jgi:signal transduction histidine kinase
MIMLISATALLLTGSLYTVYEQATLRRAEAHSLWAQAGVVGDNCRAALAFSESSDAEDTLKSLRAQPTITFACVYTTDNEVLAQYQRDEEDEAVEAPACGAKGWRFEGHEVIAFRPIEHNGEVMGVVHLRSSLDHLRKILARNISILASLLLVSLAVAYLLMARLQRIISGPILGLTETAEAISQNNEYTKCLVEHGRDELGTLIESFNSMVDTIQESQAKLMEENAERRRAEENLAKHLDQVEEEVEKRTRELRESNVSLAKEVAERQQAESNLRTAQQRLVETAHRAGMADVASEVLHNVGNILNSINVTTTQMSEIVAGSKADTLVKVTALLDEHRDDLGVFLSEDSKGKHIPVFLSEVSGLLRNDRDRLGEMLKALARNVQHIKDTITTQQSYARVSGVEEPVSIEEVIEDALQINRAGLERHGARLVLELEPLPPVQVNKQKVVQILVNLINNGKYALSYRKGADKVMCIRMYRHDEDSLRIEVIDNGIGIAQENLTKIFRHGFTTKKNGHGFGLHSGALAAKEMGGSLRVESEGPGHGAKFTLELPYRPVARGQETTV